jgi:hypothetical protein
MFVHAILVTRLRPSLEFAKVYGAWSGEGRNGRWGVGWTLVTGETTMIERNDAIEPSIADPVLDESGF